MSEQVTPPAGRTKLVLQYNPSDAAGARLPIEAEPAPTTRTLRPRKIAGGSVPSPRPLYDGQPGLSVHAGANEDDAASVADLAVELGIGAVYSTRMKLAARKRRARSLVSIHSAAGGDVTTLVFDAARYSGRGRDIGATLLDPDWIRFQLSLGLPYAYTDSPYLPAGDTAGLDSVLTQSVQLELPVVAVLPLALDWLKRRGNVQLLIDRVNRAGIPVAVVLEHAKDPLGVQGAVKGLVALIRNSDQPVVLLRSDVSAIGAVAVDASMGCVGTRSGQRHLFPIVTGKGPGRDSRISMFVPSSMCYRRIDTVAAAMASASEEEQWFRCDCRTCQGRTLDYVDTHELAYQHSVASLGDLAAQVLQDPDAAKDSWLEKCRHAQSVNLDLNQRLDGGWPEQDFQGAWPVALAGDQS